MALALAMGLHCTAQAETYGLIAAIFAGGDLHQPGEQYAANLEYAARSAGWPLALQLDSDSDGVTWRSWRPGQAEHNQLRVPAPAVTTASAEALSEFLQWAAVEAPADRLVLVVYGHGTSASGRRWDGRTTGRWPVLGMGSGPGQDPLQPPELALAIRRALNSRVDLIVLDCCYGASAEVAWDLREVGKVILACPDRLPATGLCWQALLGSVTSGDGPQAIAQKWARSTGSLTALRTDRLEPLLKAIVQLSTVMAHGMRGLAPLVSRALSECPSWGAEQEMRDLRRFCKTIATSPHQEAGRAANEAIRAVDSCILSEGGRVAVPFPGGLGPLIRGAPSGGFSEISGWESMTREYYTRLRHLLQLTGNGREHDGAAA
ncbi:MAG TPA: hypothetical protein DEP45_07590 [Armatimonadetes bacterium]|nr:hypothetical protein [Armatimonadota bacterium]